jgi:hypothetical protein
LWKDRLKSVILGSNSPVASGNGTVAAVGAWPAGFPAEETTRQSRGLEQFLLSLRDAGSTSILDLGVANQANINYITNSGHRISSENMLHILDSIWPDPERSESRKIEDFLDECLNFPEKGFGGILMWDILQHLPPPLLEAVIERISCLLHPGAQLLAFFHSEEKARTIPAYSYRIVDSKTLLLAPRGLRNRESYFNNRALEKMFERFGAVKFFLTRDHLREVIVKR